MIVLYVMFLLSIFCSLNSSFWLAPSRFSIIFYSGKLIFKSLFSVGARAATYPPLFYGLFYFVLFSNLFSNVPLSVSPVMYYYYTISISFAFWVSIIILTCRTQIIAFVSHLMPYGSPMFLAILLPGVELFSQLIRPLTLMIRLSTNLSAGHIMLYMFSFFALSSFSLSIMIYVLLVMLIVLEVSISLLQAYIFTSLSYLYMAESL